MEDNTKASVKKSKLTESTVGSKNAIKTVLVAALVVALAAAAIFFYTDAQNAKTLTPEAVQVRNEEETARVVGDLGSVILLDAELNPTVARVEDPTVLQEGNPDFYQNAESGDYLVLYPQRAIIYRDSTKQIVNVAPIINTDEILQSQQ